MKNKREIEIHVHVGYAEDRAQSEAALSILRTGLRRGLTKFVAVNARTITKNGEA